MEDGKRCYLAVIWYQILKPHLPHHLPSRFLREKNAKKISPDGAPKWRLGLWYRWTDVYLFVFILSKNSYQRLGYVGHGGENSGQSPCPGEADVLAGESEKKQISQCIDTNGLPQWLSGKESACNAEDAGDTGSIPGSGRSPGGGHGNPLQYSCLENPMDRETWWAIVHEVAKSWTRLKWLSMDISIKNGGNGEWRFSITPA